MGGVGGRSSCLWVGLASVEAEVEVEAVGGGGLDGATTVVEEGGSSSSLTRFDELAGRFSTSRSASEAFRLRAVPFESTVSCWVAVSFWAGGVSRR